jgi:hypothetical protein
MRVSLIFAIIVSFMLFTVFTLANALYFKELESLIGHRMRLVTCTIPLA